MKQIQSSTEIIRRVHASGDCMSAYFTGERLAMIFTASEIRMMRSAGILARNSDGLSEFAAEYLREGVPPLAPGAILSR